MRRIAACTVLFAAVVLPCGCSYLGYQEFRPREIGQYDRMLVDPAAATISDGWLWTRGKVEGDLDGDRKDEEVILATIQGGTVDKPKPFTKAILLIRGLDANNTYKVLLRRNIFLAVNSMDQAALPRHLHLPLPGTSMRRCSAKIVDIDNSGRGIILVSLWGNMPDRRICAWHAGYRFRTGDGGANSLQRVFLSLAIQQDPEIEITDLDQDGVNELVLRQSPLPQNSDMNANGIETPDWLSVFARNGKGEFKQQNAAHAAAYDDNLLLGWYQNYFISCLGGASNAETAVFEYYIGEIYRYRKNFALAKTFLARAAKNTTSPRLRNLVKDSLRDGMDGTKDKSEK